MSTPAEPPTLAENPLEKLASENWKAISDLSDRERGGLLCFLFGYFEGNHEFQKQVAWWLKRC